MCCHVINRELLSRVSIQPLKFPSVLALLDKTVLYTSVFAVCDSYCESFLMSRSQNLYLPHKHFTSDLHYTFNITAINQYSVFSELFNGQTYRFTAGHLQA